MKEETNKKGLLDKILDGVERAGNKLPDPITMFLGLAGIVVVLSLVCSALGLTAINPTDQSTIKVLNLFSFTGLQYLWSNVISNFSGFAPLGMVLVAVVGSSVAEKSGFLVALMERFLGKSKGWVITMAIIFIGTNLNIAGDAGFIILPPLGAMLYMSIGRSPMLGLFVAYASVSAGFCAHIPLGLADALAYGFTQPAAQMVDPTYSTSMAINMYFVIISCPLLMLGGTLLTEKLMLPRFPVTSEQLAQYHFDENAGSLSPVEKKGLVVAGIAELVFVVVMLLLSLPIMGNPPILGDETGSITAPNAPFTKGIVFTVTLALLVPGIAYGVAIGKYKNDRDVWKDVNAGFAEMGGYVFMCFVISIFTNLFSVSNLGTILAINGANFLENIGFKGLPLIIGLIILSGVVNMFIGSASAKWAILAPVFVPMMMLLGYDPAITQVVYRIGDSVTNPISPLFTYLPIILGYARKYDEKSGLGSVIANMLPFSITFGIVWILQVIVWVLLDLPLGPGGGIYLSAGM